MDDGFTSRSARADFRDTYYELLLANRLAPSNEEILADLDRMSSEQMLFACSIVSDFRDDQNLQRRMK